MPRALASAPSPSQELRHFTNRDHERCVLGRLLALPPGQPLPVVMFYGVGGTGKSWLLRCLRADWSSELPSALLDLDPQAGGAPYHTDYSRAGGVAATVGLGRVPAFRPGLSFDTLTALSPVREPNHGDSSQIEGKLALEMTRSQSIENYGTRPCCRR
jgi:hypothetical protein